jgi:hypothetical protein
VRIDPFQTLPPFEADAECFNSAAAQLTLLGGALQLLV